MYFCEVRPWFIKTVPIGKLHLLCLRVYEQPCTNTNYRKSLNFLSKQIKGKKKLLRKNFLSKYVSKREKTFKMNQRIFYRFFLKKPTSSSPIPAILFDLSPSTTGTSATTR